MMTQRRNTGAVFPWSFQTPCGSDSASGSVGSPHPAACGHCQVVPCLITGGRATVANGEPAAHDNGTQLHYSLCSASPRQSFSTQLITTSSDARLNFLKCHPLLVMFIIINILHPPPLPLSASQTTDQTTTDAVSSQRRTFSFGATALDQCSRIPF